MIPNQLQEIIDEFQEFNTAEMKYELLIEYGKELQNYSEEKKTNEYLVPGCISVVYITTEVRDGKVYFSGFADSLLVKGLVSIIVQGLSGIPVQEFEQINENFLIQLGLNDSLTPSRANASVNIFKLMKRQVAAQIQSNDNTT